MVYISLTTVPKRLKYWALVEINLKSLLCQKTDKEYYVVFNIPKLYTMDENIEYVLPNELLEFAKENPKLIINRDVIDYGPIIKIYGALKFATDPNDIIIALDDDYAYHEDLIETHIRKLEQYPNYVVCFHSDAAVEKISYIEEGIKKFEMHFSRVDFPLQKDSYVRGPAHNGSVSYRRYYFKDDFNEKLFALADGDDPLMGYYLKKHQIAVIMARWPMTMDNMPVTMRIPFPEPSGGWLIREKCSQTIHGRQDKELEIFLTDNNYKYIEKK